jgi:seryl-tRNA synthetase
VPRFRCASEPPEFYFTYDIHKKLFGSSKTISPKNMQRSSVGKQEDAEMEEGESEPVEAHRYDDDIIEMRLWNNNLDFIENMQVAYHAFESFPEYKIENFELKQEFIKEDFENRAKVVPKHLVYLRGYFGALLAAMVAFTLYINIQGSLNQQFMTNEMTIERLMF